ncbi:MAG: beta-lactamase family protein [Bacteroidales bacterium]|nr:beta-lactamase family protein [Bacteroidales bacterium]
MKKLAPIRSFVLILLPVFLFVPGCHKSESAEKPTFIPSDHVISPPGSVLKYVSLLEQYLDSTATVGAALTIVQGNKVLIQKSYGVKEVGTTDSVDVHTVFRLASCSKGFAGILACLLEDEGYFSLDDKIKTYLPGFLLKDSTSTANISLKHTLSHSSGLIPHAYDDLIEDDVPFPVVLGKLAEVDISAPPGELYGYQNVVFSLIDTIANTLTKTTYPELLAEKLFKPLKMEDASANPDIFLSKDGNFAYPHRNLGLHKYQALPVNLGYYNTAPAAGVNASISDLSLWLLALLGNMPGVLSPEILREIETPVIVSPLKYKYTVHWGRLDSKHYSLGWRIYEFMGRKIIYHGGYVKGYRAEIAFCPEAGTGIAFIQNSPNHVSSISVPTFFEMYFNELDSIPEEGPLYEPFEWEDDSESNLTEGGSGSN